MRGSNVKIKASFRKIVRRLFREYYMDIRRRCDERLTEKSKLVMMVKLGLGLAAAAGILELPLVADDSGGTTVALL